MSLIPCILLGLVSYQWFTDPTSIALEFGIDYEDMSNHGQNSLFRDLQLFLLHPLCFVFLHFLLLDHLGS